SDAYGSSVTPALADVLIVDGIDRWQFQTTENPGALNHQFASMAGAAIARRTFDTAANEAVINMSINLSDYKAVVWLLGEESTQDETFSDEEQSLVTLFLKNYGGRLFFSGAEVGWDLVAQGSTSDTAFYQDILRHDYVADETDPLTDIAQAVADGPFNGLSDINFGAGPMTITYPDVLAPINGSSQVLTYSVGGAAAIAYTSPEEDLPEHYRV